MDKYEYKLRLEEIKTLNRKGRFQEAAQVADTIDWKKVRSISTLGIISDVYKINRRFEDAKDILLLALDQSPQNRRLLYSLCDLTIKMGQVVEAVEFYKEFVQLAPNDNSRYVLLYKIYEAQDISLEERIAVLKEYKKREYNEKWAYELAFLYHRVGLATECVEECDQLILWFGEGKFVTKAMELKMLYAPLSPAQQQTYDRRFGKPAEPEKREEPAPEPEAAPVQEVPPAEEELDIQVKTMDMGQYNTMNLQAALAESMKEVFEPQAEEPAEAMAVPEAAHAQVPSYPAAARSDYGAEDAEYQEDMSRIMQDSENWDAQATGQLKTSEIPQEEAQPVVEEKPVQAATVQLAEENLVQAAAVSQPVAAQISVPAPHPAAQSAPQEAPMVEKQITGQMNLEDVLAEWERLKKDNAEKRKQETRQWMLQQTGALFDEFEQKTKDGILEKLEREAAIQTPKSAPQPRPVNAAARVIMAQQGVLQESVTQAEAAKPAVKEVVMEQPVSEKRAAKQSVVEQPAAEKAVSTQPAPEQPAPEPVQEAARQEQPVAEEPVSEQPAEEPSVQEQPAQEQPAKRAPVSGDTAALHARMRETEFRAHVHELSKQEKELFAPFVPTKGAMRQLVAALEQISLSAYTGNVVLTGAPGSDIMKLAKNMIRVVRASDENFSGRIAKISGDVLNTKKAPALISQIANGALIVEKAGKLSSEGAENLYNALNQDHTGIIVFLLDTKRAIGRLKDRCPELMSCFTAAYDIAAMDSATLVKYGCQYAYNQEFSIDELGRLALHTCIEDRQTSSHAVTPEEVREIVDEAIDRALKKSFRHFIDVLLRKRYDEEDMIILRERDFM